MHKEKWLTTIQAMQRDLKHVFRELFGLPENQSALLAGLLIESLEPEQNPDAEKLWLKEAERRWQEIESGAVKTIPWEEVKAKLFAL